MHLHFDSSVCLCALCADNAITLLPTQLEGELLFGLQLPSKESASAAVILLGLVWAALGGSLLLATEYLQDAHSK